MSTVSPGSACSYIVIPIEQLSTSPLYPFTQNETELRELKTSIRQNGLVQPLLVRPSKDKYEIICGYRRAQACMQLGISELPCIVRQLTDTEVLTYMLVDNIHRRQQLRESEIARAVQQLLHLYNHQGKASPSGPVRSNSQVAAQLLLTVSQVKCYARAAQVEEDLLELLDKHILPLSVVSILADIDPDMHAHIAKCVQAEGAVRLTVPIAKRLVQEQAAAPLTREQIEGILLHQPSAASSAINISFAPSELAPYINLHQPQADIKKDLLQLLLRATCDNE